MKNARIVAFSIVAVLGCLIAVQFQTASAQKTKGKTRLAETKYLMRGIVRPNCAALGKLLKDGPKTDKEWDTAACHASCLNEACHLLMADGRCPDGVWATAAKKNLGAGSEEVLAAVKSKDGEAAQAAFKTVTQACASCHKAHKGK